MYKGKVKKIHEKGFGFISSDELGEDVFCPPDIVRDNSLEEGDYVQFEFYKTDKGLAVSEISKFENPLFKYAIKIDSLKVEEYDEFCNLTKEYVNSKDFSDNITTSKIRNIFSAIQNSESVKDIKMLRPKLAYLSGRDKRTSFFMKDLDDLVKKIENKTQLNNFKQFFEAIICYKKEIE